MPTFKNTQLTTDTGLLLIRIMLGVVFIFHGSQKLFGWFDGGGLAGMAGFLESGNIPMPHVSAFLAAATECFGGIVLIRGNGTGLGSVPLAFAMFIASFVAHGGGFSAQTGGMEYALTLAVISVALVLTGPGNFVTSRFVKSRSTSTTSATSLA